ncbi:coiled-coil domain-containing protein [Crystallibacter degradans]|uniref:coiled-coil domain-containing protein n=1 Tax=Crystallibacter degradans TaxID=2726743 RepID=UPI0014731FE3|nr:hypothetical protein [Arthrobacter sp. SF27]NMR31215.1 hypothetical protein [Arthrobacter sp. SF27]
MFLVMALVVGSSGPVYADELDKRKNALESQIAEVQQSMDFLDADIIETVAQLQGYQDELPAAQQSLAAAQARVAAAADEVAVLAQRVDLAQGTKNTLTEQRERDREEMAANRAVIGQIASQAYKSGGIPSGISLLLGAESPDSLTHSIDIVNQALRSQNAAIEQLSQQNAINFNSEARLIAVEEEIRDLKPGRGGPCEVGNVYIEDRGGKRTSGWSTPQTDVK